MSHQDPLSEILSQLRFLLQQPVDFTRTDPEATEAKVRLLTAAATYFNVMAVTEFGGRQGLARDPRLVEQVVAAAFQTYAEIDPHPGPFDKAAMLLRGITQGHPFNDGNKRTGFLTATYYLRLVGVQPQHPVDVDEAVALCIRVSAGELRDVEQIASELQRLWR